LHAHAQRGFALVGAGRAGTSVAVALAERGWDLVAVAGHSIDTPSVRDLVDRWADRGGVQARAVPDVGRDVELVIIATPDAAIAEVAAALAPGLEPDALVLHLSGACTLDELRKLGVERSDVRLGSLHPLQSLPSGELGSARLAGSWCAIDGPVEVERLAVSLGLRPFRVDAAQRVRYHAAATIASNHVVALLAQAQRVAADAGVPLEAFLPLVRATIDNVELLGAESALTGPVARGDVDTVRRHLDALPADDANAYRAVADLARTLAGHDDTVMRDLLAEGAS
jgi:predicted short-subunit dehydrogenase-like oxidoreductase (DUF2520 family)